jgi:hypothetical protein
MSYDGRTSPPSFCGATRAGATLKISSSVHSFVRKSRIADCESLKSHLSGLLRPNGSDKELLVKVSDELNELRALPEESQVPLDYSLLRRSRLFGFIQNRVYQNSYNLSPFSQNFSIFNKLRANSLSRLIISSGVRLPLMSLRKVTSLFTVFNASSVCSDVLLSLLSESRLSSPKLYRVPSSWYRNLDQFLCRTVR